MAYTTVIDEDHLSTFKSKAEANIHRVVNVTKLKLGLVQYYVDYKMWVDEQLRENERIKRETGIIPIVNSRDVFHASFESWLRFTVITPDGPKTRHPLRVISYHPGIGYVDNDIADALSVDSGTDFDVVPMPESLKRKL